MLVAYSNLGVQFVSRLRVGARPVHIYAVNQTNTLWSHSDAEGIFYIIPLNNTNNISVSKTVKVGDLCSAAMPGWLSSIPALEFWWSVMKQREGWHSAWQETRKSSCAGFGC